MGVKGFEHAALQVTTAFGQTFFTAQQRWLRILLEHATVKGFEHAALQVTTALGQTFFTAQQRWLRILWEHATIRGLSMQRFRSQLLLDKHFSQHNSADYVFSWNMPRQGVWACSASGHNCSWTNIFHSTTALTTCFQMNVYHQQTLTWTRSYMNVESTGLTFAALKKWTLY
jgi:hypothetical protein